MWSGVKNVNGLNRVRKLRELHGRGFANTANFTRTKMTSVLGAKGEANDL